MRRLLLIAGLAPVAAAAQPSGVQAGCTAAGGPAIEVEVAGLRDRTGRLKLELYPANDRDFLRDDRELLGEGKVFRRVWADMPARGDVRMCIRAPAPGRYALLFTHDRDGRNKFNFMRDGAGFPGGGRIGRSRPKLEEAVVAVPAGGTRVRVRVQYMRGLSGFGPVD